MLDSFEHFLVRGLRLLDAYNVGKLKANRASWAIGEQMTFTSGLKPY